MPLVLSTSNARTGLGHAWPLGGQHDPELLPNGHILLFDNHGNYLSPEGISRVIEIDPNTLGIVWQYAGTATRPLASDIRSEQQRLPNGNTLIVESDGGRLVEVTLRRRNRLGVSQSRPRAGARRHRGIDCHYVVGTAHPARRH